MFRYDIYINDQFWRTLEYDYEADIARIFNDVNAARYLGELDGYLANGRMAVRIVPKKDLTPGEV